MNNEIKPLYLQDLVFLSKELPKIEFLNHEEQVIANYKLGGWMKVSDYVLFVHQLHALLTPNKSLRERFTECVVTYTAKVRWFLTGLTNRLKPYRYVGVVTGKDAERFIWNMNNPRKASKEEVERIREARENFNKIIKKAKI